MDAFESFVKRQTVAKRPFLAHLCLHSIHEPHPAMPEWYDVYKRDPDYLGTLSQMDLQFGRLMQILQENNISENTVRVFVCWAPFPVQPRLGLRLC